ncbi:alpha/beta hydrolase [Streptomyces mashuensis]|uniref:Alpha/beta hydrolase n=1 Tax=Streptomyces mashuensis TaxID=33904 RepID=A0A919B9V8_9ACTN|nr:alpha/beta hydrolase [Streptomyces mashuensis]
MHEALPPGGEGRGVALLVPGFTGSKEDFLALLEPLARAGYRVVAVDGRGQYETPGPDDDEAAYAQKELAADVLALVAALGGERVHLLGHSFGGLVCRAAVLADPAPFASLTLMSSGAGAIAPAQQARTRRLVEGLTAFGMEAVWQAMQQEEDAEGGAADAGTPPELAEFLHRRWLSTRRAQLLAAARQLVEEPDRTAELAALELPLHVVSGAEDYAWPVPGLNAFAAALSAARTVVAGAGHSPNAERPQETAEALAAFWDAADGVSRTCPA